MQLFLESISFIFLAIQNINKVSDYILSQVIARPEEKCSLTPYFADHRARLEGKCSLTPYFFSQVIEHSLKKNVV